MWNIFPHFSSKLSQLEESWILEKVTKLPGCSKISKNFYCWNLKIQNQPFFPRKGKVGPKISVFSPTMQLAQWMISNRQKLPPRNFDFNWLEFFVESRLVWIEKKSEIIFKTVKRKLMFEWGGQLEAPIIIDLIQRFSTFFSSVSLFFCLNHHLIYNDSPKKKEMKYLEWNAANYSKHNIANRKYGDGYSSNKNGWNINFHIPHNAPLRLLKYLFFSLSLSFY